MDDQAAADAALLFEIEAARERTLGWLASMQAPGLPAFVLRISRAHDPLHFPGVLLPGTYNGLLCRLLLDASVPPADRPPLIAWIESFRDRSGLFHIPEMRPEDTFKKPDPAATAEYIGFHLTNYALGAIAELDPDRPPTLVFARPFLDPLNLKAWLALRDLRDPWQEGNNIVNLAGFFILFLRFGSAVERAAAGQALELLIDWHVRLQEPATGFWGVGQAMDPERLLHAMAGAVHNFHLFYACGRSVPYQERAIDYVLARPPGAVESACLDVDLVDLLVHGAMLTGHRPAETAPWLRKKLRALLDFANPDGGFADQRSGTRRQDGWVNGYAEPQGLSNTFATWFRWVAIAMIAGHLWPGWRRWRFRRTIGIGYRLEPPP